MDNTTAGTAITSIVDEQPSSANAGSFNLGHPNISDGSAVNKTVLKAFIVSLIFQIIQVGAYPILIARILDEAGYKDSTIGVYSAFSWITVFILGPFVPFVIERLGYKTSTAVSLCATVISSGILLTTSDPVLFGIAAALMGLGLILRWIAFDTLVVELAPEGKRGGVVGLHEALMGLGIAVGPALFIFASSATIGALFIVSSTLAFLSFAAATWPGTKLHRNENTGSFHLGLLAPLFLAVVSASIAGSIESASLSFFPIHFQNFGHAFTDSAIFVTAFGLGGTILQPVLGGIADRIRYRAAHTLCIGVVVLASSVLILFPHNYLVILMALFLLGGAAGGFNTLAVIEAGTIMSSHKIPAAMTAIAMSYTFGGVLGPITAGSLINAGGNNGLLYLFISLSIVLLAILLLFSKMKKQIEGH